MQIEFTSGCRVCSDSVRDTRTAIHAVKAPRFTPIVDKMDFIFYIKTQMKFRRELSETKLTSIN